MVAGLIHLAAPTAQLMPVRVFNSTLLRPSERSIPLDVIICAVARLGHEQNVHCPTRLRAGRFVTLLTGSGGQAC
jgi:hypothetical protein